MMAEERNFHTNHIQPYLTMVNHWLHPTTPPVAMASGPAPVLFAVALVVLAQLPGRDALCHAADLIHLEARFGGQAVNH